VVKRIAHAQVADLSPHDFRRTVADDLFDNDVDLVMGHKLLRHPNVQPAAQDDRRGAWAKQQAVGMVHRPERWRALHKAVFCHAGRSEESSRNTKPVPL
jgi:hypothetical protein